MPQTDAIQWLHGTLATPSNIFTTTATTGYSDNELDFGAPSSGTSYPYLPQFPSLTEKAYTTPPEIPGEAGMVMGVHLVISTTVVGTVGGQTAGIINVLSDSTTAATDIIASRTIPIAKLIAGNHFFVPVPGAAVLEFLRCAFQAVTHAADSGTGVAWYGPKTGGEQ